MDKLVDLSPLEFDETDSIHVTDVVGDVNCLLLPRHVYCLQEGSTTMETTKS